MFEPRSSIDIWGLGRSKVIDRYSRRCQMMEQCCLVIHRILVVNDQGMCSLRYQTETPKIVDRQKRQDVKEYIHRNWQQHVGYGLQSVSGCIQIVEVFFGKCHAMNDQYHCQRPSFTAEPVEIWLAVIRVWNRTSGRKDGDYNADYPSYDILASPRWVLLEAPNNWISIDPEIFSGWSLLFIFALPPWSHMACRDLEPDAHTHTSL